MLNSILQKVKFENGSFAFQLPDEFLEIGVNFMDIFKVMIVFVGAVSLGKREKRFFELAEIVAIDARSSFPLVSGRVIFICRFADFR